MAFVNEYVSKEDIKKYHLDEAYLKRHPEYEILPLEFNPMWTIDRERNIYFQRTGGAHQAHIDEHWIQFHLNWDDKIFICRLAYGSGGSSKYNEIPYIIVWDLISINPPDLYQIPHQQVVQILKEALIAFGDDGAHSFVQNAIVKFNF